MSKEDFLKEYRDKRDFSKTPESYGEEGGSIGNTFVIQKHQSRTLHYDFRIEVGGLMKSWAVPKGPSVDPKDKRLAVPTEDHPLEYADFEGVIPEGEYGAGTVMVWDKGTYKNIHKNEGKPVSMEDSLEMGKVVVRLDGDKLRGGFALIRTGGGGDKRWLLIKKSDDEADPERDVLGEEPDSALTGRSLEEIEEEGKGR